MKNAIIFLVFLLLLGGGIFFYLNNAKKTAAPTQTQTMQKVGVTSKMGVISQIGGGFFIQEKGFEPAEIDSYSVELVNYVGKNVEVRGQYSGDTLFVSEVIIK